MFQIIFSFKIYVGTPPKITLFVFSFPESNDFITAIELLLMTVPLFIEELKTIHTQLPILIFFGGLILVFDSKSTIELKSIVSISIDRLNKQLSLIEIPVFDSQ